LVESSSLWLDWLFTLSEELVWLDQPSSIDSWTSGNLLGYFSFVAFCWFHLSIYFCYIEYLIGPMTDHNLVTQRSEVLGASSPSSDKMNLVLVKEFANFSRYQKSTSVTAFAKSDKVCLVTASNKWVIDSGATNHMTGNPNIFSSFQPHKAPSPVTVADGSTCNSVGFGIVKPIPSITCHLC